jgi:hypothetical protein
MSHQSQIKELLKKEKEALCFRDICDCLTCKECQPIELESQNHLSGSCPNLNPCASSPTGNGYGGGDSLTAPDN